MLAAVEAGVPVVEYTPAEIKRAVVGYGRAEKHQVQQMVKLLLGLPALPSPHDAADALAVAICHVTLDGAGACGAGSPAPRRGEGGGELAAVPAGTLVIASPPRPDPRKQPNRIVVDVERRRLRRVRAALDVLRPRRAGSEIALRIHTHVREDALALLRLRDAARAGAVRAADRRQRHRPEAGAGGAVRASSRPNLIRAIERGDVARLTAIPGVGKKTAERIVLELKDRLPRVEPPPAARRRRPRRRCCATTCSRR